MSHRSTCFTALVAAVAVFMSAQAVRADPQIFGYLEWVEIFPERASVVAKLDTGADHSSLDARAITEYERGGQRWVRFDAAIGEGKIVRFERELEDITEIKRHDGNHQSRPVVLMEVCLGTVRRTVRVSLINRKRLKFRMLIGRSLLQDIALVDASKTHLRRAVCQKSGGTTGQNSGQNSGGPTGGTAGAK